MKTLLSIVLLGLIAFLGYNAYVQVFPCARVVVYRVGEVDPRFNISEDEFLEYVQGAEEEWEREAGKELFRYDPDARFTVNLVFDERQERTNEAEAAKDVLDEESDMLKETEEEYRALERRVAAEKSSYQRRSGAYERDLAEYNAEVERVNAKGGADPAESLMLESWRARLEEEDAALDRERRGLNALVRELNEKGLELTDVVEAYNEHVADFNRAFGSSVEFNQGLYTGDAITIYQFSAPDDLRAVLAHEFGHAIGLDHVNDPNAVMYYKIDAEAHSNTALTEADKEALESACHL